MSKQIVAAAVCALGVASPSLANAGGEVSYSHSYSSAAYGGAYGAGAYAPPGPSYARPMGMYHGSHCNPCGPMPYGYSAGYGGGGGFGGGFFGNDILTAGLLGVGLGYLFFH